MTAKFHADNQAFRRLLNDAVNVKLIGYAGDAPAFAELPLGWILHVQAGDGSPWEYFNSLPQGKRAFSHLWVSKLGHIEQYQALGREAWAQVAGNSAYWSVETEGLPTEALTTAQLDTLARIHYAFEVMLNKSLDHIAAAPGEPGIGTHAMGGEAWGGHACPGPIRAGQRQEILNIANELRVR